MKFLASREEKLNAPHALHLNYNNFTLESSRLTRHVFIFESVFKVSETEVASGGLTRFVTFLLYLSDQILFTVQALRSEIVME